VPEVSVIVTTRPPRAKILRDGVVLAETPDAIKVPKGETLEVVLKKDGFVEKTVVVNPAKGRKLLVKLDKEKKPKSPPVAAAPAAAPQAPAQAPAPAAPPPAPKPPAPPPPSDALSHTVEKLAASLAPGAHRIGHFYGGQALEEDGRSDWYFPLEVGRCYLFVATAGPGVQELLIYLWGPDGKRAAPRAEGRPNATIEYCAKAFGQHHFQAKVGDGKGEYKMGIYQK
jgi:hypothetical protein